MDDKIEIPFAVERPVKAPTGGVAATNLQDLNNMLETVRAQIERREKGPLGFVKAMVRKAQAHSLWMLTFGLACCAIEMMATGTSTYDLDRLGIIPRGSPRQADMIILAGTLPVQMADQTAKVWAQMAEPKYSIAMGVCASDGGPYTLYGYSVLPGADRKIPVNVYVPGCPPRPEALLNGVMELRRMIEEGKIHSSQVVIDRDHTDEEGRPLILRYHYINGLKVSVEIVRRTRWGVLHDKKPEGVKRGAEVPQLGNTAELNELGNVLKSRFNAMFRDEMVPTVSIPPGLIRPLCTLLKEEYGFSRLTSMMSVDMKTTIDLMYHVENRSKHQVLALHVELPRHEPIIDSISDVWKMGIASERKEYDLMGVVFRGHPHLERIMLPPDWAGHPLRHDYVFPEEFHGASMY